MANNAILIMGESGTGKSTSLRNLNPEETFIINVLDKPLPFKGAKGKYKQKKGGNYFPTDNSAMIVKIISNINANRPEIKNIIIDDFQYIMANEYMRRARERGYDKFTEMAQNVSFILNAVTQTRDDLFCFMLSHTESNDSTGKVKCKTIGKMIDNVITLEGVFTIVLHSMIVERQYKFLTQNDGTHIAKSPLGMFDEIYLDNDLAVIKKQIINYYGE